MCSCLFLNPSCDFYYCLAYNTFIALQEKQSVCFNSVERDSNIWLLNWLMKYAVSHVVRRGGVLDLVIKIPVTMAVSRRGVLGLDAWLWLLVQPPANADATRQHDGLYQ